MAMSSPPVSIQSNSCFSSPRRRNGRVLSPPPTAPAATFLWVRAVWGGWKDRSVPSTSSNSGKEVGRGSDCFLRSGLAGAHPTRLPHSPGPPGGERRGDGEEGRGAAKREDSEAPFVLASERNGRALRARFGFCAFLPELETLLGRRGDFLGGGEECEVAGERGVEMTEGRCCAQIG